MEGDGFSPECFATPGPCGQDRLPRFGEAGGRTTNRFDLQYWEGAREAALAIYEYVNERKDVPEDVRGYVTRVLKESGERKNRGFREELELPTPPTARARPR